MKLFFVIFFIFQGNAEETSPILNITEFTLRHLDNFIEEDFTAISTCNFNETEETGLLGLINFIAINYLTGCVNVILYDKKFEEESSKLNFNLKNLLQNFPGDYVNGQITDSLTINDDFLIPQINKCTHYLLFLSDLTWTTKLVGRQTVSRVIVCTLSTRWKIEEYLEEPDSRKIVNLLIISHISKLDIFFGLESRSSLSEFTNLYTHNLLTDAVGKSTIRFLTSWRCGRLSRAINLFPTKMSKGFNGKQFLISAYEQPPFTFKKKIILDEDSNESQLWDGVEVRLLRLLGDFLNFTIEIKEPKMEINSNIGPSEIVIADVVSGVAEIGGAGIYVTNKRLTEIMFSVQHTTDCATFITKATTSLPRYRAILGPFQLSVWITLTITYLIAILPLTFADSHSFKPLIKNPWLIENMFWHVFGTFTNLFTFSENNSWTKSKKNATRLLVGWYWAFSIIITSCYTGSIISFITLFVFPDVIDRVDQLVKQNFRIGTLSSAGWRSWFNNSDHAKTKYLLRDVELIPNITAGLKNVSKSHFIPMFRPYAFLGSRAQMEYIVKANYTSSKSKESLHIIKECFVPFGVSFVYPIKAIYSDKINEYILRIQQSGLMGKLLNEFQWEVERSTTGKLLQSGTGKPLKEVGPLHRKLTLDDTQGIFLLLGAGFLIAVVALISECLSSFKKKKKTSTTSSPIPALKRLVNNLSLFCTRILLFFQNCFKTEYADSSSDYDETFYKKYDSRILKDRYLPNKMCNIRATSCRSKKELAKLFGEKINQDTRKHIISSSDLNYKTMTNNLNSSEFLRKNRATDSITSLPWEWGSDLHFRQNCDQDRLHTS